MKRMLLAAMGVFAFVAVNAQSASDNSSAAINLTVVKTVQLSPSPGQSSFDVTFDQPSQFGTQQQMGVARTWVINSTDPGVYNISFNTGSIPSAVELKYQLNENAEGFGAQTLVAQPATGNFPAGAGFGLAIKMFANVPWGVAAGNYSGTVTVTATAN